jgi:hypothetical protein
MRPGTSCFAAGCDAAGWFEIERQDAQLMGGRQDHLGSFPIRLADGATVGRPSRQFER